MIPTNDNVEYLCIYHIVTFSWKIISYLMLSVTLLLLNLNYKDNLFNYPVRNFYAVIIDWLKSMRLGTIDLTKEKIIWN